MQAKITKLKLLQRSHSLELPRDCPSHVSIRYEKKLKIGQIAELWWQSSREMGVIVKLKKLQVPKIAEGAWY